MAKALIITLLITGLKAGGKICGKTYLLMYEI